MTAGSTAIVFAALLSWSVLLVLSRVILLNFALDPWLFTFIQMMAAGIFLLMVSALVLLLVAIGIATLAQWFPGLQSAMPVEISWISTPNDIFEPTLWVAAIGVGIFLRGPSMYLALTAIHRVQTANYIAAMAALPLTSLLLEHVAVAAGLLPPAEVWNAATLFGCVMISGSLAVLWARSR